jgi:hypothetical protein
MLGLLLPLAATVHHRSTTPYVVGAVVIAILAVALVVQLKRGVKRARRR